MKTNNLLYALGLIFIAASIMLVALNPNSGRMELIAGGLAFFGFPLNIAGYLMRGGKTRAEKGFAM